MNVALLGGAFNPPHIGHVLIAQQILDFTPTDEVWFLPNFGQIPPKPVAEVHHRLAMTQLLDMPNTKVSTLEIDNKLDGDTIHLLPHLSPDHKFSFIIGSDQLPNFHLWGQWETLLQNMQFWVFPRYGYPNEPVYQNMKMISHQSLIGSNISSTKIRERIRLGLPIGQFVPQAIASYIQKNNLYRS